MSTLSTNQLNFKRGDRSILENVQVSMGAGEFIGLLGPNGSGKTSLIRILSGVCRDYQGEVKLDGKSISALSPREIARVISVVPQENHFTFPFSSLEVVLMGRHAHQKTFAFDSARDMEIARSCMLKTDCWQFAGRAIDTLSGGERQRVLLARALAQEPRILLLDEPSSHLDLKHQRELFQLLGSLNRSESLSIVCVVHDLNLASLYCQRLLFLKDGRVVSDGKPSDVLSEDNLSAIFDVRLEKAMAPDGRAIFIPLR